MLQLKIGEWDQVKLEYFHAKANLDLNFSVYAIVIEKNRVPKTYKKKKV